MRKTPVSPEISGIATLARALCDPTRIRTLLALTGGELCLCQIVDLFRLAPSTLSRHLGVLVDAGLVRRRTQGRWHYFRLPGPGAPPEVRRALDWIGTALRDDPVVANDASALRRVLDKAPKEMTACYRS